MSVVLRPDAARRVPGLPGARDEYYAGTLVAQAGLPEEAARSKSIADHDSLFANGLDTPDLFVLVVESDGEPVGNVVFGPRERHGRRLAFLYDLQITPEHRGRGSAPGRWRSSATRLGPSGSSGSS